MKKIAWIILGCWLLLPSANAEEVKVPFVGCPADGQAGALAPPIGNSRTVQIDGSLPVPLAYYKGAQGSGVFAPAGWHCRVWYGSSGAFLIVTPEPIKPPYFPPPSYAAPVVEISTVIGGTSGRFEAARFSEMLFPTLTKKFVEDVGREEAMLGEKPKHKKKRHTDSLKYLSPRIIQFLTPANEIGLGTEGHIRPTDRRIQGIVVLQESEGDPPDVSILRASLGEGDQAFAPLILKLNAECMSTSEGC